MNTPNNIAYTLQQAHQFFLAHQEQIENADGAADAFSDLLHSLEVHKEYIDETSPLEYGEM